MTKIIIGLLIFILTIHGIAIINYWYWQYFWLDMLMHFLGGFWVAMLFFWLRQKTQIDADQNADKRGYIGDNSRNNPRISALLTIVSCFGFVALIGVSWEFLEFLYDVFVSSRGYFGYLQLGAADTISDLFFDLVGGLAFILIRRLSNDIRSF